MNNNKWKLWIDTGGTFTDCIATDSSGNIHRIKVLSNSSLRGKISDTIDNYRIKIYHSWGFSENILNGYKLKILGEDNFLSTIQHFDPASRTISMADPLPGIFLKNAEFEITANEEAPTLAARIATKTPINLALPPMEMRLGSTKGTNALLERKGARVCLVVTKGFKDLIEIGTQQRRDIFSLNIIKNIPVYNSVIEADERIGSGGEIIKPLSEEEINRLVESLKKLNPESVAIAFINSYANGDHEKTLKEKLKEKGFKSVSISSEMANEVKILPRAHTTVINAYLQPIIEKYLSSVRSKFPEGKLRVMTSYGGLVDSEFFTPKDSLLSGPAGGVVGAAKIARALGEEKIITFDMGGTSTDVSRIYGNFDYSFESEIDKIPIFSPVLSIETVAAGGGSICSFDGFKLTVGPESAGANPGPACYGAGGPLTVTDVNYLLGRLDQENFGIPISKEAAKKAFDEIKKKLPPQKSDEHILLGFLQIANEKMADAIRKISLSKGYNPAEFALLAFGGAGGQNACALADLLDLQKIIVPFDAGLLSAYGMGMADIERIAQRQLLLPLSDVKNGLKQVINDLEEEAYNLLKLEGFVEENRNIKLRQIFMRFKGQESSLEINTDNPDELKDLFRDKYEKIYGHWLENEIIEIESIKVVAAGNSLSVEDEGKKGNRYIPEKEKETDTFIKDEWKKIPAYQWEALKEGAEIAGPALLLSSNSTLFIDEGWSAEIRSGKNASLNRIGKQVVSNADKAVNEFAELELFTNRFRAVAADMGAILQRSSFSVNVKERLDFSCAVLDPKGYLVANAPHIPVHLGSLGICVRSILSHFTLEKGDVIITNHPAFGGSHLPDITLVSAVFDENSQLLGYVANRAHHAELGGKTPGSMPPDAKNLSEEGVVISPHYLVKNGEAQWHTIKELLIKSPFPSRAVEENIADLNGALASIKTGEDALRKLSLQFGADKVKLYMERLQEYASACVSRAFENIDDAVREAREFLDDGSCLSVKVRKEGEKIFFDFTGTSATHPGNLNATRAIINSAIIYVLRLTIWENIPLNEGIMKNVEIIAPEGTLLNPVFDDKPEKCPAVVGGNTEVSQRVVDTLIKALKLASCSQGTMNNLIFGNDRFGFYETICGGTGAGDGFHGADAVHQHMTNTKITDPEILERRYPVRLEKMEIRKNSGGRGKWNGGNGIIREITFLEKVNVSVLTQHRKEAPYGMEGGEPGKPGKQFIAKKDGTMVSLNGIDGSLVEAGDKIIIETPGGGGWGKA